MTEADLLTGVPSSEPTQRELEVLDAVTRPRATYASAALELGIKQSPPGPRGGSRSVGGKSVRIASSAMVVQDERTRGAPFATTRAAYGSSSWALDRRVGHRHCPEGGVTAS